MQSTAVTCTSDERPFLVRVFGQDIEGHLEMGADLIGTGKGVDTAMQGLDVQHPHVQHPRTVYNLSALDPRRWTQELLLEEWLLRSQSSGRPPIPPCPAQYTPSFEFFPS